jgi:hypothetical protein
MQKLKNLYMFKASMYHHLAVHPHSPVHPTKRIFISLLVILTLLFVITLLFILTHLFIITYQLLSGATVSLTPKHILSTWQTHILGLFWNRKGKMKNHSP